MYPSLHRGADLTRLRYTNARSRPECPTVAQVYRSVPPLPIEETCQTVLARFFTDAALYALPVVDARQVPVALIERQQYVEYFGKPFSHELYGRRSIAQFMRLVPRIVNEDPIVVSASTSIDDIATIIIDRGMQHMVSGFIVAADGRYAGIANGHDLLNEITQRKQAELYYLAHYDQLTGLPNRMLFADRLDQACREAGRRKSLVALMFIDLDRFKQVNDSLGHSAGDQLLRDVAQRLGNSARDCDTVARLGGDEFAIIAEDLHEGEDAERLAERIVVALRGPFNLMGQEVCISASVGIAIYPRDDAEVSGLLAKSDAAMFEKKRNGRNGFRRYTEGLHIGSIDRLALETDLRRAVEQGEFALHFQPQINLATGQVIGVEALVRWRHPVRGLLSPGQFIEIAEETGLIVPLGLWVLRQACLQARVWAEAGAPRLRVSINVSAMQFREPGFCRSVENVVKEAGIDPACIELELTESIVMHHGGEVQLTLEKLKGIGVHLAIDDFGTGFSSLSYLRRFPIDRLKIDQSFTRDIDRTPVNESIVRAVVALARSLSLDLTAEGAETEAEVAALRACGCNEAQGYFFLRPSTAESFMAWLKQRQNHAVEEKRAFAPAAPLAWMGNI